MVGSVLDLINDKPTLFIIVGIIFLALAIGVKFSGKIELDPKRQTIAGAIGVIFLLIGVAATYYPTNITVYGEVTKWDGFPLPYASIKIGSIEDITDINGKYVVAGVSRDSTDLILNWQGNVRNISLVLPKERDKRDYEFPINLKLMPVKISGTIYDEFDDAIRNNAKVSVERAPAVTTDSMGYYQINNVPCTSMSPSSLEVFVDGIIRKRMQNFFVSEEEIVSGYKEFDVHLASTSTIAVNGVVSYYNKSCSEPNEPIPGAIVEIGSANGTSDPEGKYSIPYVSRKATAYNATLNGSPLQSGKLDVKMDQPEYLNTRTYKQMICVPAQDRRGT